ncbi:hypothetical protein, partial [Mariniflexile sp. HMF6888]|uniref:hypothetical protein n=1 Tax=Mariniflexile sp. HMF6888 TaxID=3373086 RepID=UPI0037998A72
MKKITLFFVGVLCMLSVANAQDVTVFDFDGTTPSTITGWGDSFTSVANPVSDGVNSSANVGEYIHTNQWASRTIEGLSINARYYTSYQFKVYSPVAGSLYIGLINATGGEMKGKSHTLAITSGWTTITEPVVAGQIITAISIAFNSGDVPVVPAVNVYLDDLTFIKTANTTGIVLYNENFSAPGEWDSWTGAPSLKTGKYNGGIDLVTVGDAPISLPQQWNDNGHMLKIVPTDAAVTISNINVAGFKNLVLSVDLAATPNIEVSADGGSWAALTFSAGVATLPTATNTISLRLNPDASADVFLDNLRITGEVSSLGTNSNQLSDNSIKYYPNPFTKDFNIEAVKSQEPIRVTIFDI